MSLQWIFVVKIHNCFLYFVVGTGGEPAKHVEGSLKLTQMGCPDCMLIFASEEEMLSHFTQSPHQPPPFSQPNKCPVMTCDMNFPNKAKLVWHLREGRHGQACPQCGKSFPKVKNIILKSFSINSQSCPFYSLTILSCTSEVIQLIGHLLVSIVTNPTRMHLLCILTSRLITQWQKDHIFVQNVELHL